jgi:hypothetical protein
MEPAIDSPGVEAAVQEWAEDHVRKYAIDAGQPPRPNLDWIDTVNETFPSLSRSECVAVIKKVLELCIDLTLKAVERKPDDSLGLGDLTTSGEIDKLEHYPEAARRFIPILKNPEGVRARGPLSALACARLLVTFGDYGDEDVELLLRRIKSEALERHDLTNTPSRSLYALSHAKPHDKRRAIDTVLWLLDQIPTDLYNSALVNALPGFGDDAIPALIHILGNHAAPETREAAAEALGEIGAATEEVVAALREASEDSGAIPVLETDYTPRELLEGPAPTVADMAQRVLDSIYPAPANRVNVRKELVQCRGDGSLIGLPTIGPTTALWDGQTFLVTRSERYRVQICFTTGERWMPGRDYPEPAHLVDILVNGEALEAEWESFIYGGYYGTKYERYLPFREGDRVSLRESSQASSGTELWDFEIWINIG